jgi:hypothetical protein
MKSFHFRCHGAVGKGRVLFPAAKAKLITATVVPDVPYHRSICDNPVLLQILNHCYTDGSLSRRAVQ